MSREIREERIFDSSFCRTTPTLAPTSTEVYGGRDSGALYAVKRNHLMSLASFVGQAPANESAWRPNARTHDRVRWAVKDGSKFLVRH